MKAVLVIEMPDGVSLDEWFAVKIVVDRLKATEEELMQGIPFDESKTFKFVPLRPLPKKEIVLERKINGVTANYLEMAEARIRNRIIDEILGDTE